MSLRSILILVAVGALGLAACSNGSDGATLTTTASRHVSTYPGETWTLESPEAAGYDSTLLEQAAAAIEPAGSTCTAVVYDGHLIHETYWLGTDRDTNQETWSVSKSVTSTLVGIAQDEGYLSIDEPASTYLHEWVGTDSEDVTIRNLISNDSGRQHDVITDFVKLNSVDDRTAFALELGQQAEPGTEWIYNNAAIQTLEAVLKRATGQPVQEFAHENLFDPIGITATFAVDAAGNPPTYMGVQAGCLDLARFGLLALAEGNWDGTQVVSREWLTEATSPIDINASYGYLWWLNADGGWQHATGSGIQDGIFWPELPLDSFAARGLGGQTVLVIPSEKLVITRIGDAVSPGGDQAMETLGSMVIDAKIG